MSKPLWAKINTGSSLVCKSSIGTYWLWRKISVLDYNQTIATTSIIILESLNSVITKILHNHSGSSLHIVTECETRCSMIINVTAYSIKRAIFNLHSIIHLQLTSAWGSRKPDYKLKSSLPCSRGNYRKEKDIDDPSGQQQEDILSSIRVIISHNEAAKCTLETAVWIKQLHTNDCWIMIHDKHGISNDICLHLHCLIGWAMTHMLFICFSIRTVTKLFVYPQRKTHLNDTTQSQNSNHIWCLKLTRNTASILFCIHPKTGWVLKDKKNRLESYTQKCKQVVGGI